MQSIARTQVLIALADAMEAARRYESECVAESQAAHSIGDPIATHFTSANHREALNLVTVLDREIRIFGK